MRAGVLAAGAAALVSAAAAADSTAPTFTREVAPILFGHCVRCHRDGESGAAVPLTSFASAKARASAIKAQVLARTMPPWPADPLHSLKFRNDARLSQQDIDTLSAWVDAGAPKGKDADLPPLPAVGHRWLHPQGLAPDAVLSLPEVSVAASGEIPYVQQRVKVPLAHDQWIVAMQVNPGNAALVHHMGITEVTLADGVHGDDLDALAKVARQLGMADDALMNMRPAVVDPANPEAYDMLGVYTPGSTFEMYGDASARLLKAGGNAYVNFNIHYTTTGKPERSRSELALWFQAAPPEHQLFRAPAAVAAIIANGRQLLTDDAGTKAEGTDLVVPPIPPYAANYELIGMVAYTQAITIYQLQPHAHMRGKDFTYSVVYPDGREVTVLSVPKYDFHWQFAYDLDAPLRLPAGAKLIVTAHYDNSPANAHLREIGLDPHNCGPDKEAYFRRQNQSWNEMFSPLIQYSIDGDDPVQLAGAGHPAAAGHSAAAALRVVQAVGCIARSQSRSWILERASETVAQTQSTSAAAIRAAAGIPLGRNTYELVGAGVFTPGRQEHRRVAIKGVLIEGAGNARLNVTSLQTVSGTCP